MFFDLKFIDNPALLTLLAVSVISTLLLCTVYRSRIATLRRHLKSHSAPSSQGMKPLSVIVYSKGSSEALERLLPLLLAQDYDAPMEVVVATDGRSIRAEEIVTRLSLSHHNLRMTYVPDEAHSLSRKKLAITLGIKAAKYDNVLLTDANALPNSDRWLQLIGRHFSEGKEVVIGVTIPRDSEGRGEKGMCAFDTLATLTTYLSSAIKGHPYRASDTNLAFAKRLFFQHKGFADSVGLHHGIDDLFVSSIANGGNTAVELSPEAIPSLCCQNLKAHHINDKIQHSFTGRRISHSSRRFFGLGSLLMWIWAGVTIATGFAAYPNLLPLAISLGFGLIWMVIVTISWVHASRALTISMRPFSLPVLMLSRPLYNFAVRIKGRAFRSKNYTWSKPY